MGTGDAMTDAVARVEAGEDDPACLVGGGILKPPTVMSGERLGPVTLGEAVSIAKVRQVFFPVGSSLQVQPAAGVAGLAGLAADNGAGRHREPRADAVRRPGRRGRAGADRDGASSAPRRADPVRDPA